MTQDMNKALLLIDTLLNDIVVCARTGSYADAASKMNTCIQQMQPVLLSGTIPAEPLKRLTYSLETVFLFQKQSDWVAVADIIEFEFRELLKQAVNTIGKKK